MADPPDNTPADDAQELEARARWMGMKVPTYLRFMENCRKRGHGYAFQSAVRQLFRRYSQTLRQLEARPSGPYNEGIGDRNEHA